MQTNGERGEKRPLATIAGRSSRGKWSFTIIVSVEKISQFRKLLYAVFSVEHCQHFIPELYSIFYAKTQIKELSIRIKGKTLNFLNDQPFSSTNQIYCPVCYFHAGKKF